MKKYLLLFLAFVSPFYMYSAVLSEVCDADVYPTDDERELIEAGSKILNKIKTLESDVAESEEIEDVTEAKNEMERLLKGAFKKYEKDISRVLKKRDGRGPEIEQLVKDIEIAILSFAKTLKEKSKELSL